MQLRVTLTAFLLTGLGAASTPLLQAQEPVRGAPLGPPPASPGTRAAQDDGAGPRPFVGPRLRRERGGRAEGPWLRDVRPSGGERHGGSGPHAAERLRRRAAETQGAPGAPGAERQGTAQPRGLARGAHLPEPVRERIRAAREAGDQERLRALRARLQRWRDGAGVEKPPARGERGFAPRRGGRTSPEGVAVEPRGERRSRPRDL